MAVFVSLTVVGVLLTVISATSAGASVSVQRIYGTDAIGTSIAVSQAEFPNQGSARAVVLARSDFFSDALAGGPLAARQGGPLLITPGASQSSTLDSRVQSEIQRVLPTGSTVYILGGPLAMSTGIDATLQSMGYVPQRIAGANEFATAVDVAQQLGNPSVIFEATGLSFQDALSSVPAATATGGAILLTNGSTQAPETSSYLAAHPGDTRYAIGGPLAAYGADPTATPVYGQTLYDTSAAVAGRFFPTPTVFGAATGTFFADALSGGVFMGARQAAGPMLLVQPSGSLPQSIANYLAGTAPDMSQGYLFGGSLAVGNDVLSELGSIGPLETPNWSGYFATGGFNGVRGTFTVPYLMAGAPSSSAMGTWVGLDGVTNGSVIQSGIGEFPDPNNTNSFYLYAWWETFPAPAVQITSVTVAPGDQISVSIQQVASGVWSITFNDNSNGQTFSTDQSYNGSGSSSEWIVEAPAELVNGSYVQQQLAPYTPEVPFSNLGYGGTLGALYGSVIVQSSIQVSTPSDLAGDGFNVAYGSTPPAPRTRSHASVPQRPLTGVPAPPGSVPPLKY